MFQLVNGIEEHGVVRSGGYFCESEVMDDQMQIRGNNYTSPASQTSKNTANGNIITLTLKNNHLIVETEERAVSILPRS